MKRFRTIRRGEWKGYIFNSVGMFLLALFALVALGSLGFGVIFFMFVAVFLSFMPPYVRSLQVNPRSRNYRSGRGFSYYRTSELKKMGTMFFSLISYVIAVILFCFSDQFEWWLLLVGLIGFILIPIFQLSTKAGRNEMNKHIRLAERLYAAGVLAHDEPIHAAYGNVHEREWSKFLQRTPSYQTELTEREKEEPYEPLHLLIINDHELVICTKKPNQPFIFSTIPLKEIRQLYVSASSFKEVMISNSALKQHNQMLVIGNGYYRQYHFEFSNEFYERAIHSFITELLLHMDESQRRVEPYSSRRRMHPAYVPFEQIPMLSSTDEVYLPFMKPSR